MHGDFLYKEANENKNEHHHSSRGIHILGKWIHLGCIPECKTCKDKFMEDLDLHLTPENISQPEIHREGFQGL